MKKKRLKQSKKSEFKDWGVALIEALVILFIIKKFLFGLYYVPSGSAEPNLLVGDRIWGNKLSYFFQPIKHNDYVIFDNPTFDYNESSALKRWWQDNIGVSIPIFGIPAGPENVIKRVIAIPGDTIEGKIKKGKAVIYLNGKKLDEPYVNQYPLVKVCKKIGFFKRKKVGPIPIPNFLRRKIKKTYYTFDTKKSLEDQKFYKLTQSELVRNKQTGALRIRKNALFRNADSEEIQLIDQFGPLTIPPGKYWVMGDNRLNSQDSRYWGLLDEKLIRGKMSFIIYSIDTEESLWIFELFKHPLDFLTKKVRWNRFFSCIIK
ncbi:MAG: signal peptidase I [Myxococcales bacterium]|nr:signal peptidase I [Myxococcales bacterium]